MDVFTRIAPVIFSAGGLVGWAMANPAAAAELSSEVADVAEAFGANDVAEAANEIAALLNF